MQVTIRSNFVTLTGYVTATARDSKLLPPSMTGAEKDSYEQIVPGTFTRAISDSGGKIQLKFNHSRVIGSLGKELELKEDNVGLRVRAVTDDPEVLSAAREGRLTGWSWGMQILHEQQPQQVSETVLRRYVDHIKLTEVSVLTKEPASVATTIETRAMLDTQEPPEVTPDYTARIKYLELQKEKMQYRGDYGKPTEFRGTAQWKKIREVVRKRDDYRCRVCVRTGKPAQQDKSIEVHHIVPIEENDSLKLEQSNLICLCRLHHEQAEKGELSKAYLKKTI